MEWENLPLHLSSSAWCIFSCQTACLQTRHTTLAFHTRGGLCPSTQNFPAIACGDLRLVRCFVGIKPNFIFRSSTNGSGLERLNLPRLETASGWCGASRNHLKTRWVPHLQALRNRVFLGSRSLLGAVVHSSFFANIKRLFVQTIRSYLTLAHLELAPIPTVGRTPALAMTTFFRSAS